MSKRQQDGWITVKRHWCHEYRIGGMRVATVAKDKDSGEWIVTYASTRNDGKFQHVDLRHCRNVVEYNLRTAVYECDFTKFNKEEHN